MILDLKEFFKKNEMHQRFEINFDAKELEIDDWFMIGRITGHLDLYYSDDNLFGDLNYTYAYTEPCARCNEMVEVSQTTDVTLSIDNESEEDLYVSLVDDKINLIPVIIDGIYLSKPMRALCSEECKGICPECGSNKNIKPCECEGQKIDPRLKDLMNLLDKEV